MKLLPQVAIAGILLTTTVFVWAQAPQEEMWPVTERCVGDATGPPADWSFEGTLILTSSGRVHTYRYEWETPRIILFESNVIGERKLSPDANWVAVVEGRRIESFYGWSTIVGFDVDAIAVHSTTTDESYTIEWENEYTAQTRLIGHELHWIDNEHLLYSKDIDGEENWYVINPFTGEIENWEKPFSPSAFDFILSPDADSAVIVNWSSNGLLVHNEARYGLDFRAYDIYWKPDSMFFAAYSRPETEHTINSFALFDLFGQRIQTLMTIDEDDEYAGLRNPWSPNERYLLFGVNTLHIADFQEQVIIDTCIPVRLWDTVAWAATNDQFVFRRTYDDDREIQIVDMARWERYIVGYHYGAVIGWRAD